MSVVENAPTGTELLVLGATDGDLGDNGTVRFSLQEAETDQRSLSPGSCVWEVEYYLFLGQGGTNSTPVGSGHRSGVTSPVINGSHKCEPPGY